MMPQIAQKQAITVDKATASHPATWRFDNRIMERKMAISLQHAIISRSVINPRV
jgi:hypothetical protein